MATNCPPLVADLFLFGYERGFIMSLSDDKQADIINAFNTTSRYLDDILNIIFFLQDGMSNIHFSDLQCFNLINFNTIPLIPKPRFELAFVYF